MLKKRLFLISFVVALLSFQSTVRAADNMTIFLKSAAYGTAAGAVLGLATLAWSDNPGSRINNVARGASLGLYAGIGFGLYTIYAPKPSSASDYTQLPYQMWFSPVTTTAGEQPKVDGAQMNWAFYSF